MDSPALVSGDWKPVELLGRRDLSNTRPASLRSPSLLGPSLLLLLFSVLRRRRRRWRKDLQLLILPGIHRLLASLHRIHVQRILQSVAKSIDRSAFDAPLRAGSTEKKKKRAMGVRKVVENSMRREKCLEDFVEFESFASELLFEMPQSIHFCCNRRSES